MRASWCKNQEVLAMNTPLLKLKKRALDEMKGLNGFKREALNAAVLETDNVLVLLKQTKPNVMEIHLKIGRILALYEAGGLFG